MSTQEQPNHQKQNNSIHQTQLEEGSGDKKPINWKEQYSKANPDDLSQSRPEEEQQIKSKGKQEEIPEQQRFIQSDLTKAKCFKEEATKLFSEKQYGQAVQVYKKALQYCSSSQSQEQKLKAILYSNIGICYSKMSQPNTDFNRQVIRCCKRSVEEDPKYYKAWLNLAKHQELVDDIEDALESYRQADKIDSENGKVEAFVKAKIVLLEPKVNEINEKRKTEVINGLKNIGNSVLGYFGLSLDNFKLQQGEGGGYNVQFNQGQNKNS